MNLLDFIGQESGRSIFFVGGAIAMMLSWKISFNRWIEPLLWKKSRTFSISSITSFTATSEKGPVRASSCSKFSPSMNSWTR
jgi:hypothetical protein